MPGPTQQVTQPGGQSAGDPAVEQQFSENAAVVPAGGGTSVIVILHIDGHGPFIAAHKRARLLWNSLGLRGI